jgi:hypothetical protein
MVAPDGSKGRGQSRQRSRHPDGGWSWPGAESRWCDEGRRHPDAWSRRRDESTRPMMPNVPGMRAHGCAGATDKGGCPSGWHGDTDAWLGETARVRRAGGGRGVARSSGASQKGRVLNHPVTLEGRPIWSVSIRRRHDITGRSGPGAHAAARRGMNAATLLMEERLRETMVRWVLLMVVDMMSGLFRRTNG